MLLLSPAQIEQLIDSGFATTVQLKLLDGYYLCPKGPDGERLGPLAGYAGRDKEERQLVGDVYANFAYAEEVPALMYSWAQRILPQVEPYLSQIDAFLGAPRGGESFADKLALVTRRYYLYPEKRVVELATTTSREKTKLVFQRHQVMPGMRVALVEDVMNNFTTTGSLIDLVAQSGGTVTALIGIFNRSPGVESTFQYAGQDFPVLALERNPLPEYHQDDPAVKDDVAAGNVVWKPKDEWQKMKEVMEYHP